MSPPESIKSSIYRLDPRVDDLQKEQVGVIEDVAVLTERVANLAEKFELLIDTLEEKIKNSDATSEKLIGRIDNLVTLQYETAKRLDKVEEHVAKKNKLSEMWTSSGWAIGVAGVSVFATKIVEVFWHKWF